MLCALNWDKKRGRMKGICFFSTFYDFENRDVTALYTESVDKGVTTGFTKTIRYLSF